MWHYLTHNHFVNGFENEVKRLAISPFFSYISVDRKCFHMTLIKIYMHRKENSNNNKQTSINCIDKHYKKKAQGYLAPTISSCHSGLLSRDALLHGKDLLVLLMTSSAEKIFLFSLWLDLYLSLAKRWCSNKKILWALTIKFKTPLWGKSMGMQTLKCHFLS